MWPRAGLCLLLAQLAACAAPPAQRYHEAVATLRAGHARAYYDAMLRLATESPDARAGRRARAVLLAGPQALGEERVPLAWGASEQASAADGAGAEDAPGEPVEQLRTLADMQEAFHQDNGRFCRDFTECSFEPPRPAHYYYFLGEHAVAGGSDSQSTVEAEEQIRVWLKARRLFKPARGRQFRVVAVGLIGDTGVDVWTIDERKEPVHLNDDPRTLGRH